MTTESAAVGVIETIPGSPRTEMRKTSTKSPAIARSKNLLGLEFQKCFRSLMIRRSSNSDIDNHLKCKCMKLPKMTEQLKKGRP